MSNIKTQLGKNIRVYRQAKNITLSDFSKMIHKSKSTVSKYENGEIAIDIETLYIIADALNIDISQLLQLETPISEIKSTEVVTHIKKEYLYLFDGMSNKIIRSLIKTSETHGSKQGEVTMFYNIPSFDKYEKCRSLYYGTTHHQDFVTNYFFQNQTNSIERLYMCFLNPIEVSERRFGLLSGISARTLLPVSAKCILSPIPLKEDEELNQLLLLTKEDIRLTKRFNMFVIDNLV